MYECVESRTSLFYNALAADPKESITVKHTTFMHVYYLILNFIISYIYDYYTRISPNLISAKKNRTAELIDRSYGKSFKFKKGLPESLRNRNLRSVTSKISRRTHIDSHIYVPLFERECHPWGNMNFNLPID